MYVRTNVLVVEEEEKKIFQALVVATELDPAAPRVWNKTDK